jgi:TolA-binding protein
MKKLFFLFAALLSSCTSVTVLRTHEVKAIVDSSMLVMSKRVDSLALVIDSMRIEQNKGLSRLNAEFAHISSKVSSQEDKSEARMEEISFRLDRLLAAQQKSAGAKSAAGSEKNAKSAAAEQRDSEMESLYNASRADYLRGEYAIAYNGFKQIYETLNTGEMAENSLYWMGMCMLDAGKRENAETLFKSLFEKYPQGQKACAVLFKLASMAEESKNAAEQKAYLQRLLGTPHCAKSNEFQRAADILGN